MSGPSLQLRLQGLHRQALHNFKIRFAGLTHHRSFSNLPEDTVYSGPTTQSTKRVTLRSLRKKYAAKEPITMVTAYDYPSAVHVSHASQSSPDVILPWSFLWVGPMHGHGGFADICAIFFPLFTHTWPGSVGGRLPKRHGSVLALHKRPAYSMSIPMSYLFLVDLTFY